MTNEEVKAYSPYWVIYYYWEDGYEGGIRQYYTTYKNPVLHDKPAVVKWWNEEMAYSGNVGDRIGSINESDVESDGVEWWND